MTREEYIVEIAEKIEGMKEKNILFKNFQIIIIWYICNVKHTK